MVTSRHVTVVTLDPVKGITPSKRLTKYFTHVNILPKTIPNTRAVRICREGGGGSLNGHPIVY